MTRIRSAVTTGLLATMLAMLAACEPANDTTPAPTGGADTAATAPATAPAGETAGTPPPAAADDGTPVAAEAPVEESATTEQADEAPLARDIVLPKDAPSPARTDWKYKAGTHFRELTSAQGTSSAPGRIEVTEVFWYGCPHCFDLEPKVKAWAAKLPPDVSFVQLPVMWNPTNEIHARVFYTAEALGKLEEINAAMYRGIHLENKPLVDEDAIREVFEDAGVPADEFNRTFRSFAVDSKLQRAKDLTLKYRVKGVPLLVVNGRYATEGPGIRSQEDLLAVAEELIARERQAR